MEITGLIRELLFRHDCVTVPGFGGFIGNYTPARIDRSSGIIYPPVKQISFNRNLNHNDGLLVGRISEVTGLNYGDARNISGEYVSDILRRLSNGERVVMEGIGSFVNNSEGNIQYEPAAEINYHLNSYGFEPVLFAPLPGFGQGLHKTQRSVSADKRSSIGKYLWRAAVIIPVAGTIAAVTLTTDIFRSGSQFTNMNPLASVEFDSNKNAPSVSGNITGQQVEATTEKPDPGVSSVAEPLQPVEEYLVIAGSFQSESNANVLMQKLSSDGFSPSLITAGNGFYRVCAVKCKSLGEAVARKDSISLKYSGSWITKAGQ
jgi:nucleoid DNA-binding protein